MLTPVRCFTCGKVFTQNIWTKHKDNTDSGMSPSESMKSLGLNRYCCRLVLTTSIDISDKVLSYIPKNEQ